MTTEPAQSDLLAPRTPAALRVVVVILAVTPIIILSQMLAHWRLDVVDDQLFGFFGWRIAHGATVYLDVWDNKPPGIYWINALGFLLSGGDDYAGVIALCVVALVGTLAAFYCAASTIYFPGAAAIGTILASFFFTHGYYQGGANRTETFLMLFEMSAVALYMRSHTRDRSWRWLLVGGLCGAAFFCKQVGLAAWGAMGLHTILLVVMRDLNWHCGLRRCLLLLAGLLMTIAAVCGALWTQGALAAAWFAMFDVNRAYMEVGRSNPTGSYLNLFMLREHYLLVMKLPFLMAIAALIHAALWRMRPAFRPRQIADAITLRAERCPRAMPLCLIWFGAAFYGAVLSPHYFRHYLLPTLPPLLLAATYLINVIKGEMRLIDRLQQRAWVAAAFVAIGYFAWDAGTRQWEEVSKVWLDRDPRRGPDGEWVYKLTDWEKTGDIIAAHTEPGEAVQCWDYLPGAYLRAKRPNTSRYATVEKVRHLQGTEMERLISDQIRDALLANPPRILCIRTSDYEWFTRPPDPERPLIEIEKWLGAWAVEHYEVLEVLSAADDVTVLRRKQDE